MPELPEVETTRRGIEPLVRGRSISRVVYRIDRLRRPLPDPDLIVGQRIRAVRRRAKYLLFEMDEGWLIIHLGMTGHLAVLDEGASPRRHDHVDLVLSARHVLRFNDSRRFGLILWTDKEPQGHPLLAGLGVEPLCPGFTADTLYGKSRGRKTTVKSFLMDQRTVVGVGNIYASEALFRAGIHPQVAAFALSLDRYDQLAAAIRQVLHEALQAGGTTLRDFAQPDGRAGYFRIALQVYGRAGQPCRACAHPVKTTRMAGRSTYYCPHCQK